MTNPERNNQSSLHSVLTDIIQVRGGKRLSHMSPNQTLERLGTHTITWALLVLHVVARYGLGICQPRELFELDEST